MRTIKALYASLSKAIQQFWTQLCCRHDWMPVHHSYYCPKCEKFDKE